MARFITLVARSGALYIASLMLFVALSAGMAVGAPYAGMVMDARSGEILYQENADTRLHPASLTKMMTLYVTFEAVRNGEMTMDTMVTVSQNAANEVPSKLGLRAGQKIALRYLVRASAIRSANDAATAIAEHIGGSEAGFAERMNRTAAALGMSRTTFKNAHGLTANGHLSTAHDMTILGRALFHHYPEYYNLFSRRTADAKIATVSNTNRRLLNSYPGADGIKTGYTNAAGSNLVASAHRGSERVIATVFGGNGSAARNAKVAELLDLGFSRAPTHVATRMPPRPAYDSNKGFLVASSPRPFARPARGGAIPVVTASNDGDAVAAAVAGAIASRSAAVEPSPGAISASGAAPKAASSSGAIGSAPAVAVARAMLPADIGSPAPRPVLAAARAAERTEVVTRVSTSGGRNWGINLGAYNTEYQAEQVLLKTALTEIGTLEDALRKVSRSPQGWEANFLGMTQDRAAVACQRLSARDMTCEMLTPG